MFIISVYIAHNVQQTYTAGQAKKPIALSPIKPLIHRKIRVTYSCFPLSDQHPINAQIRRGGFQSISHDSDVFTTARGLCVRRGC